MSASSLAEMMNQLVKVFTKRRSSEVVVADRANVKKSCHAVVLFLGRDQITTVSIEHFLFKNSSLSSAKHKTESTAPDAEQVLAVAKKFGRKTLIYIGGLTCENAEVFTTAIDLLIQKDFRCVAIVDSVKDNAVCENLSKLKAKTISLSTLALNYF